MYSVLGASDASLHRESTDTGTAAVGRGFIMRMVHPYSTLQLHGKGRGVGVPPGPNAGQLPVTKVDLMGLLLGVKVVTVPSAASAPTPSCTGPHTHQAPTYLLCPLPPTPSRPYLAQHCLHVFVCHPTPRLERARKRARACERERERVR